MGNMMERLSRLKRINPLALGKQVLVSIRLLLSTTVFINAYFFMKISDWVFSWRFFPKSLHSLLHPVYAKIKDGIHLLSRKFYRGKSISNLSLVDLAVKNMMFKKSRTLVTIIGMSVGITAIVFLVSIGYGLQNVVISQVIKLEEMQQADVSVQPGSQLKISDEIVAEIESLTHVESVEPVIALVARINYQNSASDVAVYGVTNNYLKNSAMRTTHGEFFSNDETSLPYRSSDDVSAEVKGTTIVRKDVISGEKIGNVQFTVDADAWIPVREAPSVYARVIGYTTRVEGVQTGSEYWGGIYSKEEELDVIIQSPEGDSLEKWIYAPFQLWSKTFCYDRDKECYSDMYQISTEEDKNVQISRKGYITEQDLSIITLETDEAHILGEQDVAGEFDDVEIVSQIELIELEENMEGIVEDLITKVSLDDSAQKVALVNSSMLEVLGIHEDDAVGQEFETIFVVTSNLLDTYNEKVESETATYEIVGVVPQGGAPLFYVPFIDLRGLGITNYSIARVQVSANDHLTNVRQKIEALGFITDSVADTKEQIDSLFSTLRKALFVIGSFALAVAVLGMFNMLTVSLMERTREVGLMKAMGMSAREVRDLFLIESMIMGFYGGIIGIVMGFVAGKLISAVLSAFAIAQGVGYLDISYIPPNFGLIIVVISLAVGTLTGIFPARRATKISALNALRYE